MLNRRAHKYIVHVNIHTIYIYSRTYRKGHLQGQPTCFVRPLFEEQFVSIHIKSNLRLQATCLDRPLYTTQEACQDRLYCTSWKSQVQLHRVSKSESSLQIYLLFSSLVEKSQPCLWTWAVKLSGRSMQRFSRPISRPWVTPISRMERGCRSPSRIWAAVKSTLRPSLIILMEGESWSSDILPLALITLIFNGGRILD